MFRVWQILLNLFRRKKGEDNNSIPPDFQETEKISRTIFSPINLKANLKLKNNAFTTPAGMDEVSVNRLDFTTSHFIKKISKMIASPEADRSYYGIAILDVGDIYKCNSSIVYSPNFIQEKSEKVENPYHSDIKIGFVKEQGKPLPAEFNYKVDSMVKLARFYHDKNPESEHWESGDLI